MLGLKHIQTRYYNIHLTKMVAKVSKIFTRFCIRMTEESASDHKICNIG